MVDLGAVRHNVRALRARAGTAELAAVVKADGYGLGAVAIGRAALDAGAGRLCVFTLDEAQALREGASTPRSWCWGRGPRTRRRAWPASASPAR